MPFFGPAYWTIAILLKLFTKTKITVLVENYISHENRWFDKVSSKVTLGLSRITLFVNPISNEVGYKQFIKNKRYSKLPYLFLIVFNMGDYDKVKAREFLNIKTGKVIMFFGLIRRYKGVDKFNKSFQCD